MTSFIWQNFGIVPLGTLFEAVTITTKRHGSWELMPLQLAQYLLRMIGSNRKQ